MLQIIKTLLSARSCFLQSDPDLLSTWTLPALPVCYHSHDVFMAHHQRCYTFDKHVVCVNQNLKCMVYKGSRGTSCWQLVWNAIVVLERSLNPPSHLPGQVARLLWCTSLCIWGRAWQTCFPQPFHEGYLPRWIQAPGKSTFFGVFNLASLSARHHSL